MMTTEERKYPEEVKRMTKDELTEFIHVWRAGQLYSSAHINNERDIGSCFMILSLGGLSSAPDSYINSVGLIWEYLSEAVPCRAINGHPIFFSCRFMHKDDWNKAREAIKKLDEKEKETIEGLI